MRWLVSGLMAVLLAGCAQQNFTPAIKPDLSNPQKVGHLVGSIGMKDSQFSNVILQICNEQHQPITVGPSYKVLMWPMQTEDQKEILKEGFSGNSFVIPLPEGTYEFCGFFLGADRVYFQEKQPFSLPFTVTAQKVNYVGRYTAMTIWGKSLIGLAVPAGVYWVVNDVQADDLPFILKRDASLAGLPIVSTVPPLNKLQGPLFLPKQMSN